jgi:hypothetical protein
LEKLGCSISEDVNKRIKGIHLHILDLLWASTNFSNKSRGKKIIKETPLGNSLYAKVGNED